MPPTPAPMLLLHFYDADTIFYILVARSFARLNNIADGLAIEVKHEMYNEKCDYEIPEERPSAHNLCQQK
jgi:short-subunit dehydrogenase